MPYPSKDHPDYDALADYKRRVERMTALGNMSRAEAEKRAAALTAIKYGRRWRDRGTQAPKA